MKFPLFICLIVAGRGHRMYVNGAKVAACWRHNQLLRLVGAAAVVSRTRICITRTHVSPHSNAAGKYDLRFIQKFEQTNKRANDHKHNNARGHMATAKAVSVMRTKMRGFACGSFVVHFDSASANYNIK